MIEKKENFGFSFNNLTVALITLGCDKNRVDAEKMLYKITSLGFKIAMDVQKADLIIINTCAFIKSAVDESENTISEALKIKKQNAKVIIVGCYSQRFYEKAKQIYPDSDLILKLDQNENIDEYIKNLYKVEIYSDNKNENVLDRVVSTPKHYAFLKISDGCNNFCTYCTIPYIRGRYKSEPIEKLLQEVNFLTERGVKELILIAQDVTRYGLDLYNEPSLVKLIREISKNEKIECIRLHYCYPEMVSDELIEEISTNNKVAKYIDVPLQHIADNVLKTMNRKGNSQTIKNLIKKLKEKSITIRSTFMVGFPTETKQDFKELCNFLKQEKLDYVGFFAYSPEENTKAGEMKQLPLRLKIKRLKTVQKIQTKVMKENQKNKIGKVFEAICDGYVKDGVYAMRAKECSPEVDNLIYVFSEEKLIIGNYYKVKIIKPLNIDLQGEIL